jgi:Ca2+-binding RTX toxin-like protein
VLASAARSLAGSLAVATIGFLSLPGAGLAKVDVQTDPGTIPSLLVFGDEASDAVTVSYDSGSGKLVISAPGISDTTPACIDNGDSLSCTPPTANFGPIHAAVVFRLWTGDDSVIVDGSVPSSLFFGEVGERGDDTIIGGLESDAIDPGPGTDRVSGGGGTDRVDYAQRVTPVNIALDGSPNSGNEMDGPPGARDSLASDIENIIGGNASDRLVGNALPNAISGFKGHDVLVGLGGADRLWGRGLGADFAVGAAEADRIYGGRGRDLVFGGSDGDQLFGGPGIDRIDAKDKQHEKVIDCGPGNDRHERATRDGGDPHPISC